MGQDQDVQFVDNSSIGRSIFMLVFIAGIIGTSFAGVVFSVVKNSQKLELKGDRLSIQKTLQENVSCTGTLSEQPAQICARRFIDLVGKMPNGREEIIISRFGSKIGSYTYRVECDATKGIVIRAALPKEARFIASAKKAHFHKDPQTQKVYTWEAKESLVFPEGAALCRTAPQRGTLASERLARVN